ncbi:MAG: hypothetical protein Q7U97_07020 [Rhodocyclaceae bacterium]|nr:hypothetical protein [Rhodocyclaceae bacterium]
MQDQPEIEFRLAETEAHALHQLDPLRQQTQNVQRHHAPHHERQRAFETGEPRRAGREAVAHDEHHRADQHQRGQQWNGERQQIDAVPLRQERPRRQHQQQHGGRQAEPLQAAPAEGPGGTLHLGLGRGITRRDTSHALSQPAIKAPGQHKTRRQHGHLPQHGRLLQVAPEFNQQPIGAHGNSASA